MKCDKDNFKRFLSYRVDMIKSQNLPFSDQRAITLKIGNPELMFLCSACPLMLVNICVKFHEDSLKGF